MSSRFDYVKYDNIASDDQQDAKDLVQKLELLIESINSDPRPKALALTKLEEVYMWIGKAIRDEQLKRSGDAALREERKNG